MEEEKDTCNIFSWGKKSRNKEKLKKQLQQKIKLVLDIPGSSFHLSSDQGKQSREEFHSTCQNVI